MRTLWVLVVLSAVLGATPSTADTGLSPRGQIERTGVAVDLGRVDIDEDLLPGQRYVLPRIGVRNPGASPSLYEMTMLPLDGTRNPHPGWMKFSVGRFELAPGESRSVGVVLQLPPDAVPGDYETLLAARISGGEEGTAVGAAAASRLSFTVRPSSLLQGWLLATWSFLTKYAPWSYLIPGLVLFGIAARRFGRSFRFRIERRA